MTTFPTGFLWGVASAGHQTEGDNTDSDTWFAEHVTPSVFSEPSGRACDGWARWREDVDLAAGLGLNAYRFSVEWARIEQVEGRLEDAALEHYVAIADRCRERGMAPVVTLNHFTSPHWFAMRGSWLDAEAPDRFARYSEHVVRALGDRVDMVVTMNEPNLARLLTWVALPPFVRQLERATLEAATAAAGVERYRLSNVMVPEEMDAMADGMAAGHVAARAAVKALRPELPVGLSVAVVDDVVFGDDPTVRDRKRVEVYERWLQLASHDDFVGVQNYERHYYDGTGEVNASGTPVSAGLFGGVDARSLAGAVRYAHQVSAVPVLVTEHGIATSDDSRRVALLEESMPHLRQVVDDGVPVVGYLHWTLMDNYEWVFGYGQQLGLHAVDRTTFVRTPKPSAAAYAAIVAGSA